MLSLSVSHISGESVAIQTDGQWVGGLPPSGDGLGGPKNRNHLACCNIAALKDHTRLLIHLLSEMIICFQEILFISKVPPPPTKKWKHE